MQIKEQIQYLQQAWILEFRRKVRMSYPGSSEITARIEIFESVRNGHFVAHLRGLFTDRRYDPHPLRHLERWLLDHPFPGWEDIRPADIDNQFLRKL